MDLILLEKSLLAVFCAIILSILISKLRGKKLRLPPGPLPAPIFGNWFQVGDDLNHRNLTTLAKRFGDILMLRMGQRNLVVVSSPETSCTLTGSRALNGERSRFASRSRRAEQVSA